MQERLLRAVRSRKTTSWSIGIGVVTLLSAMLSLPTLSEADVWKVLCDILTLGQAGCKPYGTEEPVPLTCSRPSIQGHPAFLKQPRGAARYRFGGTCQSPTYPGKQLTYRWEGSWTPSERNAQKPNASEAVEITGYEFFPDFRDRAPGGRIYMYWTARCQRDPWLQPAADNCQRMRPYIPADLRQGVPELLADSRSFPVTRRVISQRDRQRLLAEYKRVNPPPVAQPFVPGQGVPTPVSPPPVARPLVPGGGVPRPLTQTPHTGSTPTLRPLLKPTK
jgi:hypothetical protein